MKNSTLLRSFKALGFCASLLALGSGPGCQDKGQSSSSTNWLTCQTDADCAAVPGAACRSDFVCVDSKGRPIPASSTQLSGKAGAGASNADTSSRGGASTAGASASGGALTAGASSNGNGGFSAGAGSSGGASASAGAGNNDRNMAGGIGPSGGSAGAVSSAGGAPAGGSNLSDGGVSGSPENTAGAAGTDDCSTSASVDCSASCDTQSAANSWNAPALDKSCMTASDCFVGRHTFDCCGSIRYTAYNLSERDSFDAYEQLCQARATCTCAASSEVEDGTLLNKGATVADCIDGACRAVCTAAGCHFTSDCSAADECVQGTTCTWINPLSGANICRQPDGTCGRC